MLFSIITVSYNSATTIGRTIESVLSQNYTNYEYIIIDGNSTDDTMSIIKSYEKSFNNNLIYISEPDSGLYNAMNKGISIASGNLIGIINSDDWLQPNCLNLLANFIAKEKINISNPFIISGAIRFHYSNRKFQILDNSYSRYIRLSKIFCMGLRHPATFVSKATYQAVGKFDENIRISADMDFIIRCFNQNIQTYIIHDILTNMSDGGVSNESNFRSWNDKVYILNKYCKSSIKRRYLLFRYLFRGIVGSFISKKIFRNIQKFL